MFPSRWPCRGSVGICRVEGSGFRVWYCIWGFRFWVPRVNGLGCTSGAWLSLDLLNWGNYYLHEKHAVGLAVGLRSVKLFKLRGFSHNGNENENGSFYITSGLGFRPLQVGSKSGVKGRCRLILHGAINQLES